MAAMDRWLDDLDTLVLGAQFAWEHRGDIRLAYLPAAVKAGLACCDGDPPMSTKEGIDARITEAQAAVRAASLVTIDDDDDHLAATMDRLCEPGSVKRKIFVWFLDRQLKSTPDVLVERDLRCSRLLANRKRRKIEAREVEELLAELGIEDEDATGRKIGTAGFCEKYGFDPLTILLIISAAINIARAIVWLIQWWRNRPDAPQPTLQLGEP